MGMNRYMLIDGNNMLMRSVYAADRTGMGTPDGIATGALLIFINLLSRHIREQQPSHVMLAWDGGRSAFRTSLYPDYKSHRGERSSTPDERGPFAQAKEFCTLAGIHHMERLGWEADDLIAACWQRTRKESPSDEVAILSGDKDLLQLLDQRTYQLRPASPPAETDVWDEARVLAAYGVPSRCLSAAMALIGDTSDNVPGVRGIGPKKAAKMLVEHGLQMSGVVTALTPEQAMAARLSHALIDLRTMNYRNHGLFVPVPPAFAPTMVGSVLFPPLVRYLDRYLMDSVRSRLSLGVLWGDVSSEDGRHAVDA